MPATIDPTWSVVSSMAAYKNVSAPVMSAHPNTSNRNPVIEAPVATRIVTCTSPCSYPSTVLRHRAVPMSEGASWPPVTASTVSPASIE